METFEIQTFLILVLGTLFNAIPHFLIIIFASIYLKKSGSTSEAILFLTGSILCILSALASNFTLSMVTSFSSMNTEVIFGIIQFSSFIGYLLVSLGIIFLIRKIVKLQTTEN